MGSENGAGKILYIRADQNTEVKEPCVSVGDIASVFCADEHIMAKVKALTVFRFHKEAPKRQVISILKVIELITKEYPGIQVENLERRRYCLNGLMWRSIRDRYSGLN